ncbi:hypothetical protein ElyMa_002794000 [Elysia marginata]|uniref:Uncharacterized protein n=1 Tax=Elysia marginata TaxID=1093978 RepID=A0AAV4HQ70_9GAST|nr:hypothetical protein ElyMa_002794000 [Elysia marginata]
MEWFLGRDMLSTMEEATRKQKISKTISDRFHVQPLAFSVTARGSSSSQGTHDTTWTPSHIALGSPTSPSLQLQERKRRQESATVVAGTGHAGSEIVHVLGGNISNCLEEWKNILTSDPNILNKVKA